MSLSVSGETRADTWRRDADVRKQKETETSLSKMMSAFKQVSGRSLALNRANTLQMEIVLSRYEKDKKALQAETQLVVGPARMTGR